tara:strand:+ start:467 stop:1099 length:633 start_codon:yes stop_codon:yes gene_type:complete
MERGRKNKSPFKIFNGITDTLGAGMNRGRGGNRGRGRQRVTRDPNVYNPGRPANPTGQQQQFSPEQMEALQNMLQNMRENVTQVNPRPQPGQVGMMGAGGNNRYMFGNRGQQIGQMSRPMERFNRMTGRNNFQTMSQAMQQITGKTDPNRSNIGRFGFGDIFNRAVAGTNPSRPGGMPPHAGFRGSGKTGIIGSALSFKRKPSGFKMKKK